MEKKKQYTIEKAFDVRDFLWTLLEQWKVVVCFSLVVMALFWGTMQSKYSKQIQNATRQLEERQKKTSDDIIKELPIDEQKLVKNAYHLNKQLSYTEEYTRESPLMNTNPYHARRIYTVWIIIGEPEKGAALAEAYLSYLRSDTVCQKLLPFYGDTMSIDEVRGAISYDSLKPENNETFSCELLLYDDVDEKALATELQLAVNLAHTKISSETGEHTIKCISQEIVEGEYPELATHQKEVYERLTYINNQLKAKTDAFTNDQKSVYDRITNLDKESANKELSIKKPSSFSIIILGLILGIILYSAFLILYTFFSGTLSSNKVLEGYNLYTLGQWYHNQPKKGVKALAVDSFIYKYHFQRHLDKKESEKRTVNAILNACDNEKDSLIIAVTAPLSKEQLSYCDEVKCVLEQNGVFSELVYLTNENELFDAKSTADIDGVVIIVIDGKTRYRHIEQIVHQCIYYDVPVFGDVYFG